MATEKKFPWEFREFSPEDLDKLNVTAHENPYIFVGPKKYVCWKSYTQFSESIYNMPIKADDVFLLGYPRSGTTMSQELVWLLTHDLDFERAKSIHISERFPYLERSFTAVHSPATSDVAEEMATEQERKVAKMLRVPPAEILAGTPSPRLVKSHLPLSLLPPDLLATAKVVYLARDPRDVAVSLYKFMKSLNDTLLKVPDLKTYCYNFMDGIEFLTPYFEHLKEAWAQRNHPNMMILFYEDLRQDLGGSIRRVAAFLGKPLSEDQLQQLTQHLDFQNFKNNPAVDVELKAVNIFKKEDGFIRKGKVGGWRDEFDEELAAAAREWIARNLRGTDLRVPYFQV